VDRFEVNYLEARTVLDDARARRQLEHQALSTSRLAVLADKLKAKTTE
jgi:hypothetical protein